MIFLLKYWKYIALVLAVLSLIGMGKMYLNNAAKNATLKCELAHKNQAIKAANKAAKDKDDIANEEAKIDDIDSALRGLGILRNDNDK